MGRLKNREIHPCPQSGKRGYSDRSSARRSARLAQHSLSGYPMKPYRCPYCGQYHIATERPR